MKRIGSYFRRSFIYSVPAHLLAKRNSGTLGLAEIGNLYINYIGKLCRS
ncbi:hypothetical protein QEG73_14515 [Chitinophagaceae bacterium 26-R-25]|nr:hypothetical protein [Chitinophagaceae bacterium 26-R-25]